MHSLKPAPKTSPGAYRAFRVRKFVHSRYGLMGSLRLHRSALGRDVLRAPVNVALAPLYLLIRLASLLLKIIGLKRASAALLRQQIFMRSDLGAQLASDLNSFIASLEADGAGVSASPEQIERIVSQYCETRNAVAEIAVSLLVLLAGFVLFQRVTPGLLSLSGSVAELRAQQIAVEGFWLGNMLGRQWYGLFPVHISLWQLIWTGAGLAIVGSLLTTFIGIVTDPIQVATGTHQRRLMRLLNRLDSQPRQAGGIEREHIFARIGDLGDVLLSLWRSLRG